MSISINRLFQPLYDSDRRYFFLTGGRGSLKSTTVHDFIARLTYERGHGILFTRYTMASAELSIIPEFQITLDRMGIADDFKITKTRAINKRTKSFIYFSGIKTHGKDQTAKLKSLAGITTWVIEEGEDFKDEKAFDDIDNSIRVPTVQNRVIWIQNPTTKEHFIYKRWIKPSSRQINVKGFNVTVSNLPEVEHIHTTYHIADKVGYLDRGWLDKMLRVKKKMEQQIQDTIDNWRGGKEELELELMKIKHTSDYYYTYIGGWLEKAEGVIFDNWIEGVFDNTLPYCYGLDYGYNPDPLAMGKTAIDFKRKRIYRKSIIYDTEIDDIAQEFEDNDISKKDVIVCDTNEPRTTSKLKKKGYNLIEATKLEDSVKDDIREIKKWLIVVDPDSDDIKTEFNNYVWNNKKASVPIGEYNHHCDEMRYTFNWLTRKKKKGVRKRR